MSGRPAEQPQGPLLLEVEGPAGLFRQPPEATAEVGHRHPDRGLRQHPQPERDGGRADLVTPFHLQRGRHRPQVGVPELPVPRPPARTRRADRREQTEILAVAEHPW